MIFIQKVALQGVLPQILTTQSLCGINIKS